MAKPVKTPTGGGQGNGKAVTDAVDDTLTLSSASLSVTEYVITKEQLLANDTAKSGSLSITSAQGIDGATVEIDPQGNLHVFAANFLNPDAKFTYTVTDGKGATDTATVTVDYTLPNHAPIAVDDFARFGFGASVARILSNDTDPDGDTLALLGLGKVVGGTAEVVNLAGTDLIFFRPYSSTTDSGSVEYFVSDGHNSYDTGLRPVSA